MSNPNAAAEALLPDPVTRLTPAEKALVAKLDVTKTREEVIEELRNLLQVAIEVELATIPIYLFTYYSILRDNESGEAIGPLQAFANKAGGMIMSVAVEEMLHMSLSANVKHAMGCAPQIYRRAPASYPASLPHHNPVGPKGPHGQTADTIPLARLSFDQLWHFLQIEYPEQWDAPPQEDNWDTIGQLYSYARCLASTKFLSDADFQRGPEANAIQPYNYSPNNVDTVYPSGQFDPWKPAPPSPRPSWTGGYPGAAAVAQYPNSADSHAGKAELITVQSIADAALAIDTICDQGEGFPVTGIGPSATDDRSKREDSHYYKFLKLQAQFAEYPGTAETLPDQPPRPAPQLPAVTQQMLEEAGLIVKFPDNPVSASYPAELRPIADFCSACFQYMLILSETVFRVPPQEQKLFFNEGLHRSMIWVLDKYIRTMREIPLDGGYFMAPVFENVDLGDRKDSFDGLTKYGLAAVEAAQQLASKNKDLASVYNNIAYYAALATGHPGDLAPGKRPLVDVRPYWSE
ncbi:ferritin-like protein [Novosphingobium beihaiensis]|uniref:Ferritin-like protein n=1 Tax=Novosphingobium beihaiensis TaxID=2930389 RepID=A0ABT0BVJ4_9SPHN|nr:ferritin-like protein [Novosphingobium beihaiensis]MCJ2189100.1 ferritin-like protein [Novosphingobium beihaiensis]